MEEQSFKRRFIFPVLVVFSLMLISSVGYFGSRHIDNYYIHQIMAASSGVIYFISVAFGTLYVYTVSNIRGASITEGLAASAITPFIWMTKEVIRLTESHPIAECLYYYLNPLNFWLISFVAFEMGISTLIARYILKKRGQDIKVFTVAPIIVILISLTIVISAYAWGRGENLYVIFLEGYRLLFGSGL